MRFYAKLGGNSLAQPETENFSITEELGNIAHLTSYEIENTAANRTILTDHIGDDLVVYRESDDMELGRFKIDRGALEYTSRSRIQLSGYAAEIELAGILFKYLSSTDAQSVGKVFDYDASGPTYTDYTTAANEATVNDVMPTWGAAEDSLYIGQDTTFSVVKVKYSTAGVYVATVVIEYWDGDSWEVLDCIDDSRGFSKTAGSYFVIIPAKPDDWAKTTVNSQSKFWLRFRLSAWTSTTTAPKLDQIWIGDVDPLRVQFDNVAADTILGYVLDGEDYTEDSTDQCPSTLISLRGEYESKLRWIAAIANACTYEDANGDTRSYEWWIDTSKKVHFAQTRGEDKSSIEVSSRLTVLDNKQNYEEIATRIFGAGSYDGVNQRRAIVEDQDAQDTYGLREAVHSDLRYSVNDSLKNLIDTELSDTKAPLKEVTIEMETSEFLGFECFYGNFPYNFPIYFVSQHNGLQLGDLITVYQPEWSVNSGESGLTYRIKRILMGPSTTRVDLDIAQVHLESIASNLQRQQDIADVWMSGATSAGPLPSFAQNVEKTAGEDFYAYMQFKIPKNTKYINALTAFWYIDNFRIHSKTTDDESEHTHGITGIAISGGGSHSHGFGVSQTTQAQQDSHYVYGKIMTSYALEAVPDGNHTHYVGEAPGDSDATGYTNNRYLALTLSSYENFSIQAHYHKLQGATTVEETNHTHPITGTGTDTGSAHHHAVEYGIKEESSPASSIKVEIKVGDGSWTELSGSPYSGDQSEVDIRDLIGASPAEKVIQLRFLPNSTGRAWLRGGGDYQWFIESK